MPHRGVVLSKIVSLIVPPLCVACGADAGRGAPLCRPCRALLHDDAARSIPLSGGAARAWAPFAYDGPAGALARALKFGGRAAIADAMAAQLVARAPAGLLRGAVVPVPVHPAHRRRRGIDHTLLLARAVARRAGLPLVACLARRGDPRPQVGRGRRERISGPAGSIQPIPGIRIPKSGVVLDDVITTGATLAACVRALRAAGCQRISPIAYARTTAR